MTLKEAVKRIEELEREVAELRVANVENAANAVNRAIDSFRRGTRIYGNVIVGGAFVHDPRD